ncbi:O-antigen ligase family protein [Gemella sp. 27098_8_92]|uniref:sunset domain-containing protein n=1 Tax=Gemella sp. 27098_8_92 TaxID=3003687 RepID=UPI00352F09A6
MNKFIKEHGQMVLWFIFVIFMFISLSMVFTHGPEYAMIVFIFSFILLCPPVIKLIQRKTRIKKVVLGVIAAFVLSFTMMISNHFSEAKKEEQIRTFQEKKEEREKKTEEQADEKRDASEEGKSQNQTRTSATKQSLENEMKATMNDIKKEQEQKQKQEKAKKAVVVRASKKSGQYYTPEHPSYNQVAAKNLLVFNSEEAAQKAGYKRAA